MNWKSITKSFIKIELNYFNYYKLIKNTWYKPTKYVNIVIKVTNSNWLMEMNNEMNGISYYKLVFE